MAERTCGQCGVSIEHMRANARYCCRAHKNTAAATRCMAKHPGGTAGYWREYNARPDRATAVARWRDVNREKRLEYARAQQARYRAEHPDHAPAWWAANPEKHREYQRRRRFAKVDNPGSVGVSERDWARLLRRYRGCCAYCGVRLSLVHMDHVIPLKRGGRHAIGNVLPACPRCNVRKSACLLVEWRLRSLRRPAS